MGSHPHPTIRAWARGLLSTPHLATASNRDLFIFTLVLVSSYCLSGLFARWMATRDPYISLFWFPAGIAVAAILLMGARATAGVFLGAMLINLVSLRSLFVSAAVAACCTAEAFVAARFTSKYANGKNAFAHPSDFLRFVLLAGILAPALFAALGVFISQRAFAGWSHFWPSWFSWWSGDAIAILLCTPFVVLLIGHPHHSLGFSGTLELFFLLAGLAAVCATNFGPALLPFLPHNGFQYLCFPFFMWAAIRFCVLEVSGAALLLGVFTIWGSLRGFGPFADAGPYPVLRVGFALVSGVGAITGAIILTQQRKCLEDALCLYYVLKEELEQAHGPCANRGTDAGPKQESG